MEQREKIKNYITEYLKEINDTKSLMFIYRYTEKVALVNGGIGYETQKKQQHQQ